MAKKETAIGIKVYSKGEIKLQRKIWCTIEHWEKSNWRRITNLWMRIKNEEKRTELLEKLWTEVMEEGMKAEPKEEYGKDTLFQRRKTCSGRGERGRIFRIQVGYNTLRNVQDILFNNRRTNNRA